jgi:hypothetical protein
VYFGGRFFETPSLTWLMILLFVAAALSGCGGGPQQSERVTPVPPVPLPPPIPAADPVLLYNGVGTSADVLAVEAVLRTLGISYATADANQLNAMSEPQLGGYKLVIVPGGNSITIGDNLSANTAAMIRGAVQQYGVNYLGICAGAFFGGYSLHNGVNLTGGIAFSFYADEFKGIHKEPNFLSDQRSARRLLGRWSTAFRLGTSCSQIPRWNTSHRRRSVGQGLRDFYRRSP